MILIFFHGIHLQVFLSGLIIPEEENAIKYAKRLPSKKDESLKNYAIVGFSCKPMGTISSARKLVFEKSVAKVLQKCCKNGHPKSAKSRKAHKYWVFRHI